MELFLGALSLIAAFIGFVAREMLNDYTKSNDALGAALGLLALAMFIVSGSMLASYKAGQAKDMAAAYIAEQRDGVEAEDILIEADCIEKDDDEDCVRWAGDFRHLGEEQFLTVVSVDIFRPETEDDDFVINFSTENEMDFSLEDCEIVGPESIQIYHCVSLGKLSGVQIERAHPRETQGCISYDDNSNCQHWRYEFDAFRRGAGRIKGSVEYTSNHVISAEIHDQ